MNVKDSREIQERIDELEALEEDIDAEDKEELESLVAFKEDVGDNSEWDCGITFIDDDDFEDYARELAEDIGAIESDTHWPATCIDWERAADELRIDYSQIELDGVTYLYR